MNKNLLLVEDDAEIISLLKEGLRYEGFELTISKDGDSGLEKARQGDYGLILMDWMLPDGNGLDFIAEVKDKSQRTAVVMISARDDEESEVEALNLGADDYIRKPFEFDILVARLESRLRFGGTSVIEIGNLVIEPDEEKILYKGEEIELKGKPFEVLTHLARHRDQIVSKEQLLDAIWEEPELVTPNVIEVAINQIRQKMDKPLNIDTIETVRRRGYRFCFPQKNV